MKAVEIVLKIRKILGKITDLLLKGRQAGLWSEKPVPVDRRSTIPNKEKSMGKVFEFVARYGPLVAAFFLGLGTLIGTYLPGAQPFIDSVLQFLALFGVQADAAILTAITETIAAVLLVVGGVRKIVSLVKAYFAA